MEHRPWLLPMGDTFAEHAVEALAGQAAEAERLGRLPDATVALLLDLGMARSLVPRCWGGLEQPLAAVLDVVASLAHGCMSAAWCAALFAEHPWVLAHFPEQAQADVWSRGPDVPISMSIAAQAQATPVPGGFTLSGAWAFASGCDHARWLLLLASWPEDEGTPPHSGLFLVPRADVSIDHASWHVAGLRGTGSKTV